MNAWIYVVYGTTEDHGFGVIVTHASHGATYLPSERFALRVMRAAEIHHPRFHWKLSRVHPSGTFVVHGESR
jgi:hypothetical protein